MRRRRTEAAGGVTLVSTIWVFDKIGNFIFRLFEGSPKWKRKIGFCERLFKALLIG